MHYVKLVATLFAGGFLTSLAEHVFKYSLFETIVGLFHKKPVQ